MTHERLPEWLRKPSGAIAKTTELKRLLRNAKLNTVCEEARCPNISECFSRGTATFMILGDVCTRGCRFCSVTTGRPDFEPSNFRKEAIAVAEAAEQLRLRHVVVTSVARDDLADGGAEGFCLTIQEIRRQLPQATVEVLIPDFRGDLPALEKVVAARPDILNHNLETVPRLYRTVRPGAGYRRSLELLLAAKKMSPSLRTKTGIMLGLGERQDEVIQLMRDAAAHEIDIFTAGQYMQPTKDHLPVEKYLTPAEFVWFESEASKIGFMHVYVGPLVRSSYHADEFVMASHTHEIKRQDVAVTQ